MQHLRTVKHSASRAAVLALAGGGILIPAAAAAAAPATSWQSAQASYSCSLSGYGQGMAPLTINASMSAPASVAAGTSQTVKFMTSAAQVPSGAAAQLGQVSTISLSGASQLTWASGGSAGWSGQAALTGLISGQAGAGGLTQIPSMTATGTIAPKAAGWGYVTAPQSFQLQLERGTIQLPPLTCTTTQNAQVKVTVTGAAGAGTGAAGGTGTAGGAGTAGGTSMPQKVWMSSAPGALSGSVAAGQLASISPMNGSVWLALAGASQTGASQAGATQTGASKGVIPLAWSGNAGSGQVGFAGQWTPKAAGMFQLSAPKQFSLQVKLSQGTVLTVVCKAVTATPATMQVQVAGAAQGAGGTAGVVPGGAAGAPNTGAGGSLSTGVDLALAAGGAALVLGGAGFGAWAFRRRGHSAP